MQKASTGGKKRRRRRRRRGDTKNIRAAEVRTGILPYLKQACYPFNHEVRSHIKCSQTFWSIEAICIKEIFFKPNRKVEDAPCCDYRSANIRYDPEGRVYGCPLYRQSGPFVKQDFESNDADTLCQSDLTH